MAMSDSVGSKTAIIKYGIYAVTLILISTVLVGTSDVFWHSTHLTPVNR